MNTVEHTQHNAVARKIVEIVHGFSAGEAIAIVDLARAQLSVLWSIHQRITDQGIELVAEHPEKVPPL